MHGPSTMSPAIPNFDPEWTGGAMPVVVHLAFAFDVGLGASSLGKDRRGKRVIERIGRNICLPDPGGGLLIVAPEIGANGQSDFIIGERAGVAFIRLGDQRAELASERILDAVRALFIDKGVSGLGMVEVAEAAGCSRATLYRYFENRQALYVAFAGREALMVVQRVWRDPGLTTSDDPGEQLLHVFTALLAEVRKTPHLAVWFAPENAGIVAQLSNSSEVVDTLATDFVSGFRPDLPAPAARRTRQSKGLPLLAAHPATCDAVANLLGCTGTWETGGGESEGSALLGQYPDTALALEELLT